MGTIPEDPGSFRRLYSLVWPRNVTEFSYRFESRERADVMLSFQPKAQGENDTADDDFRRVVSSLRKSGFDCYDISENEPRQREGVPVQFSRVAGRPQAFPQLPGLPLEHYDVPLQKPRRRLREGPRGNPV